MVTRPKNPASTATPKKLAGTAAPKKPAGTAAPKKPAGTEVPTCGADAPAQKSRGGPPRRLVAALAAAARAAFTSMRNAAPSERFYAYAFYLDLEGPSSASLVCNSDEALLRAASPKGRGKQKGVEERVLEYRWAPERWPYSIESGEELEAALALLEGVGSPEGDATLRQACVEALKVLDGKGLFGTGKAREAVVLLLLETDQSEEKVLSHARELNPKGALAGIERELAPPEPKGQAVALGSRKVYSINDLVLSADGSTLAAFGASGGGEVFVWRVADWKETFSLATDRDGFWTGSLAPNGSWMVVGSKSGMLRRFSFSAGGAPAGRLGQAKGKRNDESSLVREGSPLKGHRKAIISLAVSPDGERLASSSWDDSVRLWDTSTGQSLRLAKVLARQLHFDPCGRFVAATAGLVRLLDGSSLEEFGALGRAEDRFMCSALSADGGQLAAGGGADGAPIAVFSVDARKRLVDLPGPAARLHALAFSPNGRLLAAGDASGTVSVFDLQAGRSVAAFRGKRQAISSVVFLPDDRTVAVAGRDVNNGPPVQLWTVAADGEPPNKSALTHRQGSPA